MSMGAVEHVAGSGRGRDAIGCPSAVSFGPGVSTMGHLGLARDWSQPHMAGEAQMPKI